MRNQSSGHRVISTVGTVPVLYDLIKVKALFINLPTYKNSKKTFSDSIRYSFPSDLEFANPKDVRRYVYVEPLKNSPTSTFPSQCSSFLPSREEHISVSQALINLGS